MGMLNGGHALSDKLGPSMGRTTGIGSEQRVTNAPLDKTAQPGGQDMGGMQMEGMNQRDMSMAETAPNARQVPGFPQDMFMVMDEMFKDKPETYGLRPSWTGGMMGMMTLVRVLKPEMFDKVTDLKRRQQGHPASDMPMKHGNHGGGGR